MSSNSVPLLTYAAELLQSYSRLIVYSGDILRSLPEPREGLSAANIKPKKDESTAFLREWQHLEGVFDEYIIRLNNIRTRAHEELEAARVRCLVGEDIDLTLPASVIKLTSRLEAFKKQYEVLQHITGGGSIEDAAGDDAEEVVETEELPAEPMNVKTEEAVKEEGPDEAEEEDDNDFEEAVLPASEATNPAAEPAVEAIDIGSDSHSDAIAVDSSSDVDNDADMEEIFQ
ncbi:hypothetical protein DL89DRAFT_264490 [Linderina pennispora]|uniref:Uncharacterized protein n=1 Tax=Linderina pennispora TaxID=61395 RepID=A0A1Y1WM87_9FUNG|nr:uncharacterized protein DL89DRAFT_264490 [Linderina pennispora]ORX74677.1 hypothetical protein DL89DRAFT_264490 [Linderina pennispora]